MAHIIIDLLGRKFRVRTNSWEIFLNPLEDIPRDWLPCYTADRYTGKAVNLFYSPDHKHYIIQKYTPHLKAYVRYRVRFLGYYEQFDMRFEYKYGKVKLPKQ